MEVRGQISDTGKPAHRRFDELRAAIARRDALRVRQARENLNEMSERRLEIQRAARDAVRSALTDERTQESSEGARVERASREDTIEISDQAREAAELATRASGTSDSERARRVAELRDEHAAGRLATPERIERAATRLLGGDA